MAKRLKKQLSLEGKSAKRDGFYQTEDVKEIIEEGKEKLEKEFLIPRLQKRFGYIDPKKATKDRKRVEVTQKEPPPAFADWLMPYVKVIELPGIDRETKKFLDLYPPSSRNAIFVTHWIYYIADVAKRDNFKIGHLAQLKILCDLHVECEALNQFIAKNGWSLKRIGGRFGDTYTEFPEVKQLNKVRSEIRMYSTMLGLKLTKDSATSPGHQVKDEDWLK